MNSIVLRPSGAKDRKINEVCCYYLAEALFAEGDIDEAKKYFIVGKKSMYPESKFVKKYRELENELSRRRYVGRLYNIVAGHGYGFIELLNNPGQIVFIHYSDVFTNIITRF